MRKLTMVFWAGAYLSVAGAGAYAVLSYGGGWGPALAVLSGLFAVLLSIHGLLGGAREDASLRGEVSRVRDAGLALADQVEQINVAIAQLSESVHEEAEELSSEVRVLESLVQRLAGAEAPLTLDEPIVPGRDPQQAALIETVRQALAENRVDLYLQPVVSLPQRRTLYYEGFSRLRDRTDRVLMPAEYLSVAEPCGLVSAIDNLLLFRCVQIVRRLARQERKVGIFCNISLASLSDQEFFPQFLRFLGENSDLAGSLIFELGQPAFEARGSVEARNMAKLADLGFQFSLDKVTSLELNFQDLARSDVKFLKVGAQMLISQLEEVDGALTLGPIRDLSAQDFADLARRFGVELIAEKVEDERQVTEILDLNIGFGQGHLFGQPRAIREQVLAETPPPAPFIEERLRRVVGGR